MAPAADVFDYGGAGRVTGEDEMTNLHQAMQRVRPGRMFTMPATAVNMSLPGDTIKFTFLSTVSAEQIFRFSPLGGKGGSGLPPIFVSIKVTAAAHILFGPSGDIVDPTNSAALYEPADSWQDYQLNAGDSAFKIKGDSAGGDLYLLLSSR